MLLACAETQASGVDGGEESSGDREAGIGVYDDTRGVGPMGECEYGRIFGVIGAEGEVPRDRSTNKGSEGGGDSLADKDRKYGRQRCCCSTGGVVVCEGGLAGGGDPDGGCGDVSGPIWGEGGCIKEWGV